MQKGGHMSKLVIGLSALVLLAAGGALAGGALTDSTSEFDTTTTSDTTTQGTNDTTTLGTTTNEAEDVRGPCDEAEHANDPQCTATATTERDDDDDQRGRNRGHDDNDEDRSGPNRGPG
jgi:hypothetical protein